MSIWESSCLRKPHCLRALCSIPPQNPGETPPKCLLSQGSARGYPNSSVFLLNMSWRVSGSNSIDLWCSHNQFWHSVDGHHRPLDRSKDEEMPQDHPWNYPRTGETHRRIPCGRGKCFRLWGITGISVSHDNAGDFSKATKILVEDDWVFVDQPCASHSFNLE